MKNLQSITRFALAVAILTTVACNRDKTEEEKQAVESTEVQAAPAPTRSVSPPPARSASTSRNTEDESTDGRRRMNNTAKGALIGAGAGAITGAAVSKNNRGKGAIIGGAVGAAAGAITGRAIDKKKENQDDNQ